MLIGIDASRATTAQRTGTENYALYLTQALIEIGSPHHFRLYFNQAPPPGLFSANSAVEQCVIPFPRLWTHVRLGLELRKRPPDVLFVPSHVLPMFYRGPSVVTVHDLGYLVYPQAHTSFQRWYLDWSTRLNARKADYIIADSKATRTDLKRFYGTSIDRVQVAYPAGSKLQRVSDEVVLAGCRDRYRTGRRYVLYLGSLQPRKNLPGLVRAFAQAVHSLGLAPDITLVLAGRQGWLPEDLTGIARDEGIAERLVLTGYVSESDLPALLSGSLVFVLPSFYEGFGLPVLEAMSCGVPVICSDVSSLPEAAGDAAILIDPGDTAALAEAIACACTDEQLRRGMIERGYAQAARFSWRSCAEQVLQTIEKIRR